jgi:hypothetical protein
MRGRRRLAPPLLNQLVRVEQGLSPGTVAGEYEYDEHGMRVRVRERSPGGDRHRFY